MKKILFALSGYLLLTSQVTLAFDAPAYFEQKCTSCHTLGGGDEVGPDLKGVTERRKEEWIMKFIRDSEGVINSGDPVANELFAKFKNKKMPAFDLSDQDIKYLLDFIKTGKAPGAANYRPADQANSYDKEMGEKLFTGEASFAKGGPACISCHGAGSDISGLGGGSLGPDLVISSFPGYGDKGIAKALSKISFPTMAEVYANAPLTEQENYYLRAFFMSASKRHELSSEKTHEDGDPKGKFVLLGSFMASIGILFMDMSWRKRRKKTKRPY